VLLAACASKIDSPEDYTQKRADAECKQIHDCRRGEFDRDYSSMDECVDDTSAVIEEEVEFLDLLDCDYSPEQAGLCVFRIRHLDCEEWAESEAFEACDLVFHCGTDATTGVDR
jgi:hypothetical protein